MIRRDFLQTSLKASLGLMAIPNTASAFVNQQFSNIHLPQYQGNIIIVGAGAAGLMAGYLLQKNGIQFQIMEASEVFGGRVKKLADFADFPIDAGAEWIHTSPKILRKLLGKPIQNVPVETIEYNPQKISITQDRKLEKANYLRNYYSEYKFKSTTWFDYFNEYIVPNIKDKIRLNTPIKSINYQSSKVKLTDIKGKAYTCDKVLVTVPISILQKDLIEFTPPLPAQKLAALKKVEMPPGLKVFIEFSEKFYPDVIVGDMEAMREQDYYKTFYDAAFKKDSKKNILGLLATGIPALQYAHLNDDKIIQEVLKELDNYFEGKASKTYQKHFIQDWTKHPFIQGSYSHFGRGSRRIIKILAKPINNQVFFAGEAMNTHREYATVHGAAISARDALEEMF